MNRHWAIKFNHGVEIGAALAYRGHYRRTEDPVVWNIMQDELVHQSVLKGMLRELGTEPSPIIDGGFKVVGNVVGGLCLFAPLRSLKFVARILEVFAVFNYSRLAVRYPKFKDQFLEMSEKEYDHEVYFKSRD